jgi:UDP-3-O-[3-hydroxymyristoyl] N-acetylglucosamine deacetylase
MQQKTVKHSVSCFGIGIHSGKPASLTIHPAPENSGIVFVRTDIKDQPNRIKAKYDSVSKTMLGTTISNKSGVEISIIEHLMAALWGCKIDNALIELDGPEIPIMDGSSESFVFMAECAGVKTQNATREYIEITKKIRIEDNDSFIELLPSEDFSVETTIDFKDSIISKQTYSFSEKNSSFKYSLSRARTFGHQEDAEFLKKQGLAQGASMENAVVIKDNKIMNKDGLRYKDEFVRHKLLDLIGDLYLAGAPIKGLIKSHKPGHKINNKALHVLFSDPSSYKFIKAS